MTGVVDGWAADVERLAARWRRRWCRAGATLGPADDDAEAAIRAWRSGGADAATTLALLYAADARRCQADRARGVITHR